MQKENLSKELFWNDLMKKYPQAMDVFCKWVDNYKFKNNWNYLFNGDIIRISHVRTKSPKYHDLPLALQVGIWLEFEQDTSDSILEGYDFRIDLSDPIWANEINSYLNQLELAINHKSL